MIAADLGDVLVGDDRPEALLVLEVGELAEVERLVAELLEDLVRRPVLPEVEVSEIEAGEIGGGSGGHGSPGSRVPEHRIRW